MPRNMFEERLRANKPNYYAWERQSADDITIDDMDEKLIRGAIRLGVEKNRMPATALTEPLSDVLRKLELMNDGVPNNAAAALFSTKLRGYTQMQLRLARFRGINKIEFIDNQRVEGNFFQLLDAGMAFPIHTIPSWRKCFTAPLSLKVGGLAHSYHGGLQGTECSRTEVEHQRWLHLRDIRAACNRSDEDSCGDATGIKFEPSTNQVKDLILAVSEDYLSTGEMMKTCGLKSRLRFRTTYILPALDEGAIERKYPDIPNHPRQQYRLTEQAIEWKRGQKKSL